MTKNALAGFRGLGQSCKITMQVNLARTPASFLIFERIAVIIGLQPAFGALRDFDYGHSIYTRA